MERRETLLSLDLELKTNLKGLLQFTCPVLGINHPGVCVCVCVWCAHSKQTRTKGFIHAFESAPLQVQSCFSAALVKGKTFYLSASNGPFIKVLFHSNQSHN